MKAAQAKFITVTSIRCVVILLFSYSATSKWLSYDDFMFQLQQSPFIHGNYIVISLVLPVTELSISFLLILSATERMALAASAVLLFLCTVYIGCMLLFAQSVPCSCGGFISSLSWTQHIWLNSIVMILCGWAYYLQKENSDPS